MGRTESDYAGAVKGPFLNQVARVTMIGTTDGEWPVQAFTNDQHAIHWIKGDKRRRLWRVEVRLIEEMKLVVREEYLEGI